MKRFNIVTRRTYKKKNGEEKTQWSTIGSLVQFPASGDKSEGYAIELSMFPDTKFYVFEQKPREDRQGSAQNEQVEGNAQEGEEVIPF